MKTNPKWYFAEKQIGVDYSESEIASEYDFEHQQFRDFKKEAEDMVEKLNITKKEVVLDCGCGTGEITLELASHAKEVIGVDISPSMLELLTKNAKYKQIHNIKTHCTGFLTYQHQGAKVDKMVSKFAMHHLPDFWKSVALLKMSNCLKKGGKLYFSDLVFTIPPAEYEISLNQMIDNMKKTASKSIVQETIIHIKEEFSTYDWIMEGLFKKTGFSIDSKVIETENFVTYICSKI